MKTNHEFSCNLQGDHHVDVVGLAGTTPVADHRPEHVVAFRGGWRPHREDEPAGLREDVTDAGGRGHFDEGRFLDARDSSCVGKEEQ